MIDIRRRPPPASWGVAIDLHRLDAVAQVWKFVDFQQPSFDYPGLPEFEGTDWIDFCALAVSVLACLWPPEGEIMWNVEFNGAVLEDAPALFACFTKANWELDRFAAVTDEQAKAFFAGKGNLQLIAQRAERLRGVARAIRDRWDGSVCNLMEEAGWDGASAVDLLIKTVPGYLDRVEIEEGVLPFDKLAHLCVALMAARAPHDVGRLDTFPVYPDYMLPKLLRHLGVLVYEPHLAAAVEARRLIDAESDWELAIRWATVHTGQMLIDRLRQLGNPVTGPQLDYHLWSTAVLGGDATGQGDHHRTVTLAY